MEEKSKPPIKSEDHWGKIGILYLIKESTYKSVASVYSVTALGSVTRAPQLGNSWLSYRMKFRSSASNLYSFKQATKCQLLSPSLWNVLINPFIGTWPTLSPTLVGSISLTCDEIGHLIPWAVRGACSAQSGCLHAGSLADCDWSHPRFLLQSLPTYLWMSCGHTSPLSLITFCANGLPIFVNFWHHNDDK